MRSLYTVLFTGLMLSLAACGSDTVAPGDPTPPVDTTLPADPNGILMPGEPAELVGDALVSMRPSPVPASGIVDDILTTRLDAWVDPSATVAELNAALEASDARIVSMRQGIPLITLRIDAVASRTEAQARADAIQARPEFLLVNVAAVARAEPVQLTTPESQSPNADPKVEPSTGMPGHLERLGMSAAWHALPRATALNDKVPVLVMDSFSNLSPLAEIPGMSFPATANGGVSASNHGWHVLGTIGADFEGDVPVGVHPAAGSLLDIAALPIDGLSWAEMLGDLMNHFPATGKFVISTSLGWAIDEAFAAANGGNWPTQKLVEGASLALAWRIGTADHWNRFIHATAAGNELTYGGNMTDARIESPWTIAHFYADPRDMFAAGALSANQQAALDALMNLVQTTYPAAAAAQPNVLTVGSSDANGAQSYFSNNFADLRVEGEDVRSTCVVANADCDGTSQLMSGTSMATPQVAGLAAWLWNLNNGLSSDQVRDRLIRSYTAAPGTGQASANLLTLSADASLSNAPVRRTILDIAGNSPQPGTNGLFDENDVELYLTFFDSFEVQPLQPGVNTPDFSRYDLNGDNVTSSTSKSVMDLDVNGLPELGITNLTVGSTQLQLDESSVSDLDCLCYYAYSPLYDGDEAARDVLLSAKCGGDPGSYIVEIIGMPDRFPIGEAVAISVRAGLNTGSGIEYAAGVEVDLDIDNGEASPDFGVTDDSGFFTTMVTMDSGYNEITIEAGVESETAAGVATVSAVRPDQIEILSRTVYLSAEVFSAYCPDTGVLCPRVIENWQPIEDNGLAPFDDSIMQTGSATMAGMPHSGQASASAQTSLDLSGTDFSGMTCTASVDGEITLSNPNMDILSYQAQADGWVEVEVEFVVWGEAASFSVSGSVEAQYYDIELDGDETMFVCDSSDAPCGSLSGSGSLPAGEYDFDVFIEGGGFIWWHEDCQDCDVVSGTDSGDGNIDVTLSVQH